MERTLTECVVGLVTTMDQVWVRYSINDPRGAHEWQHFRGDYHAVKIIPGTERVTILRLQTLNSSYNIGTWHPLRVPKPNCSQQHYPRYPDDDDGKWSLCTLKYMLSGTVRTAE